MQAHHKLCRIRGSSVHIFFLCISQSHLSQYIRVKTVGVCVCTCFILSRGKLRISTFRCRCRSHCLLTFCQGEWQVSSHLLQPTMKYYKKILPIRQRLTWHVSRNIEPASLQSRFQGNISNYTTMCEDSSSAWLSTHLWCSITIENFAYCIARDCKIDWQPSADIADIAGELQKIDSPRCWETTEFTTPNRTFFLWNVHFSFNIRSVMLFRLVYPIAEMVVLFFLCERQQYYSLL